MKLIIEIDMENAAFEEAYEHGNYEVISILKTLLIDVKRYGKLDSQYYKAIMDSNGNKVGQAEVRES